MQRGEVWWAYLPRPAGRRPVLILTRDDAVNQRSLLTVAPVTSTVRGIRSEVVLDERDNMTMRCAVNTDIMTTIPVISLDERITLLSDERMAEVKAAVIFALELEQPTS